MTIPGEAVTADAGGPNVVQGDLSGFELLRPFNQAGVLVAADVHTAVRLCRLGGVADEQVALAVGLAVRAPRVGHVSVDLGDIRSSATEADDDADLGLLPWPQADAWISRIGASELVDADPAGSGSGRPLKLVGRCLYLDRYWQDEIAVAAEIRSRLEGAESSPVVAAGALERLFPGAGSADQLAAARLVLSHRFSVIAGGPGTGKTTTVARLLALLLEYAVWAGRRLPLVGLAAPTGKAAARMQEAVRAEAAQIECVAPVRAALEDVRGSTLHRLLGTRFDRPGRFRHHRGHRLPHDVLVVDEASMVSLSLMAGLTEAARPDARLVLVGDPEQLVSVEAGAVLADIVGPAGGSPPPGGAVGEGAPSARPAAGSAAGGAALARSAAGSAVAGAALARSAAGSAVDGAGSARPAIAGAISVLRQNHRFAGSLARLAEAVRGGEADSVARILASGTPDVAWVQSDPGELLLRGADPAPGDALEQVKAVTLAWAGAVHERAAAGRTGEAIAELGRHRVLCGHRRGGAGVRAWNRVIQGWAADGSAPPADDYAWYPGRPVLITANDYVLRLFNGDTGVAVAAREDGGTPGRLAVAFDEGRDRPVRLVSPTRLPAVETVYAMTVHKSQGSEFDRVTLLLPPATSRLLTRELLYTAITRARRAVTVVGTAEAVEAAVTTPIARASGLGDRLWGAPR